jgi:hypothetical protein
MAGLECCNTNFDKTNVKNLHSDKKVKTSSRTLTGVKRRKYRPSKNVLIMVRAANVVVMQGRHKAHITHHARGAAR